MNIVLDLNALNIFKPVRIFPEFIVIVSPVKKIWGAIHKSRDQIFKYSQENLKLHNFDFTT